MPSTSKKHKVCWNLSDIEEEEEEDRISNLPSGLISHILSFLPTKYAVATCVLSTKWKEFWTLTTSLEFDDEFLQNRRAKKRSRLLQASFTNFVYRTLLLCRLSCLQKFHLKCSRGYDVCHINAWVASVLKHNVPKLNLCVQIESSAQLPRKLFTSSTLVELKLSMGFLLSPPEFVWLPCLKILSIDRVKCTDDDSFTRFICGCPLLDKLSLTEYAGDNVQIIKISSPLLTGLVLYRLGGNNSRSKLCKIKIALETPDLVDLVLDDAVYEGYAFKKLNCLKKESICIWPQKEPLLSNAIHGEALRDLLEGVSGVQFLRLSTNSLEAFQAHRIVLPTFQHMIELELRTLFSHNLKELPMLLEKSPHLRTLTFRDGLVDEYGGSKEDEGFHPAQNVPHCVLFHLRMIKIGYFHGSKEELEIVKYFLDNAKVLEKLIIHCNNYSRSKMKISNELLKMQRASRCQIELC